MKYKLLLAAFVMVTIFSCSKNAGSPNNNAGVSIVAESNVPATVISAFNTSFNSSTEREWRHKSNDDSFTCQFNMDDSRQEASFDDNGHQSSHSLVCESAAVPAMVLEAFRKSYATDIVYEWKLTNEGTWKAHFLRNNVKWEVTVDAAGNIVKSEYD